jgi:hypothetical protein
MDKFEKRLSGIDAEPPQFRGGVVTVRPEALLPFGSFSILQNVRGFHPGFRKRDGQTKYHTTSQIATKVITVPAYNAGATTYADAYGYDTNAVWATLRADAAAANFGISTDNANGVIVKESGGTYTIGRSYLIFDLSRYAGAGSGITGHVGDINTASIFVKLNGAASASTNIVAVNADIQNFTTMVDLNSSSAPMVAADWDLWIAKAESFTATPGYIDVSSEADGTWIEIPLNSTAIAAIEAAAGAYDKGDWGTQSPYIAVAILEYDHDYLDSAPSAAETFDSQIHLATAGSLPYLQLTMTTPEEIVKLFQWSKGKRTERHLFAQIENGDLIEASDNPPDTITGDFGSLIHQPRDVDTSQDPWPTLTVSLVNMVPASFGNADDTLIYSDGLSQHMIWTGEEAPIETFKVHKGSAQLNASGNPEDGFDYSIQVSDNDPETFADLGSLADYAVDDDASIGLNMKTWDKVAGWTDVTITDGTASGGTTFAQDGSITWTLDPNEIELFAFGENGYWYMLYLDSGDDLSATCELAEVTYEGPWQPLENVWNGVFQQAIEVYVYDSAETVYYSYPYAAVDLNELATSEHIVFSTLDNLVGFHVEMGATPNKNNSSIQCDYWDGDSWVDVVEYDNTDGFNDSGFVTWKRKENAQPREFNGSKYSAFWWRINIDTATFSEGVKATFRGLPWYDINDLGSFGTVNAVWKERGCYAFDRFPSWLYVSENNEANKLNGSDDAVLQAGDGRRNKIVAMQKFHNELMVWQEEKGRDGGCLTLFEGYSPSTFGKLLLSAKIGSFSQKAVVVIDGANSYTKKDDNVQTLAFFISHYGIYVTDGSVVTRISDDIQNYFDLRFSECIRKGYEKKMYVEHDTSSNVLRFGLVSGSTAEQCNVFPVFDLIDWTWSFDTITQAHSHVHEVEAASGQYPVLQIAASTNGFVYSINDITVDTDDGTAIDMIVRPEFNSNASMLALAEVIVRFQPVTSGQIDFKMYEDGDELNSAAETIDMTAPTSDDAQTQNLKRERLLVDADQHSNIAIQFRNNRDEDCYLYDYAVKIAQEVDR